MSILDAIRGPQDPVDGGPGLPVPPMPETAYPAGAMPLSINPKDAIGRGKIGFFSTVPLTAVVALAKVMILGARKYGALNFRQAKVAKTVYLDGILRHALKLAEGEEIDPESGETHWAHIMAGAAIGHDAAVNGMLVNDLPPLAGNTDLVEQLSKPYTPPGA